MSAKHLSNPVDHKISQFIDAVISDAARADVHFAMREEDGSLSLVTVKTTNPCKVIVGEDVNYCKGVDEVRELLMLVYDCKDEFGYTFVNLKGEFEVENYI